MPGFDGTGPRGEGSMTGGGRGYCVLPYTGDAPSKEFLSRRPTNSSFGAPRPFSYGRLRLGLGLRRGGGFGRRGGRGRF